MTQTAKFQRKWLYLYKQAWILPSGFWHIHKKSRFFPPKKNVLTRPGIQGILIL